MYQQNTDNLSRVSTSKVMDDNMKNIQKIFTYMFHIQSYGALEFKFKEYQRHTAIFSFEQDLNLLKQTFDV